MTVKKVVECDYCKVQKVLDEYAHIAIVNGWINIQRGESGVQNEHYCSEVCLKNQLNNE